jgi:hypothetical protein
MQTGEERVSRSQFIVAQLGARMHYAVPCILHAAGMLEHFYTDFSTETGWTQMLNWIPAALQPAAVRRLLGRSPKGVPRTKVTAFNALGLEYARRLRRSECTSDCTEAFLWAGRAFCNLVLARGLGNANGVYTFNSAGLELLQRARMEGLRAVMEQTIAPKRVELQLLRDEASRFPGWEASTENAGASAYCDREEEEWKSADLILCGSEFVRDGIAQCGGPVEKSVVVPYGVDVTKTKTESGKEKAERSTFSPLRVLTVGSVGLRKGSPYVLEAARQLKGKAQFRMVGSIGVEYGAEVKLREHLELIGPVPRSELARHFDWADVFLLPSLCEGSATVTYEALAYGLPVICTANTGSVVRDGVEGFVIPIRDAAAIVDKLRKLLDDSELLGRMSANGAIRAKEFTVAKYGGHLTGALRMLFPN